MTKMKRKGLGRGLDALLGANRGAAATTETPVDSATMPVANAGPLDGQMMEVPVEYLQRGKYQPRRDMHEESLQELAESIKAQGVMQPVVIRPVGTNRYEIIAGERRWRAAQKAGLHEVPIVLLDVGDAEALELAIIENVQRTDLNPLEEAMGYQVLANDYKHSQDDIASIVGKSRSHVANTLRLLKLPDSVKKFIAEGKLSAGHARALVGQPHPEELAQDIVNRGLNVRQAEALRQEAGQAPKKNKAKARKDADTAALEKRLSDALGLAVEIKHGSRGGLLQIKYKSLEQLDEVVRRLESGG